MGSITPSLPDFEALAAQLTVEEKTWLLAGKNFWEIKGVPRVGIPPLKVSDGPNGARGGQFTGGKTSACFPACVSLAATFDKDLAKTVGKGLGEETKTKGAHVLLGPTVCPHRDPRGGRNFESFSEDPFLAGELASHYIDGLQGEGVGATVKHYAVNEQETHRFSMDARVSQRALREIYLKPFEIAVKKSDPWAIMTSYNLINGTHADSHYSLLTEILRNQWKFKGLVMSDWGGTNSVAESLNAGHDLEMPGPPKQRTPENINAALKKGQLTEEILNKRVVKVLELLARTGKFENPTIPEEEAIDHPEHREIIRKAGAEGMVLLKNDRNILPLQKESLKSIAMIGLAKTYIGHGGGSAAVNSHRKINPFTAFQETLGESVDLKYAEGARIIRNLEPILDNLTNENGTSGATLSAGNDSVPLESLFFAPIENPISELATIKTCYKPPVSGSHYISFTALGTSKVYINDELVFDSTGHNADLMAFFLGAAPEQKRQYKFTAGQEYKIRIESEPSPVGSSVLSIFDNGAVGFRMGLMNETEHDADLHAEAIEVARDADVAIVFVGNTPVWETEGCDRDTMDLPKDGSLDRLIAETAKVNPKTIVINFTGSPISMPWISDVQALVQAWFPGQESGYSVADIVFGAVNPGGKLPVTFPKTINDSPAFGNFPGDIENRVVRYREDVFIGYRHYDNKPEGVLFPFGFGLSYSTFEIFNALSSAKSLMGSGTLEVTADVKNTGAVVGSEVVQVYVGAVTSTIARPKKELAGFAKVFLQPGEVKTATITFDKDALSYWNEEKNLWSVEAGTYQIYVGSSSVKIDSVLELEVGESFNYAP